MLKKLTAILFTLVFATACQTRPIDTTGSTVAGDTAAVSSIIPGSQGDLEANVGDRVFFAFDSSSLSSDSESTLNRQVQWLNANPAVTLTIEGHCDERGTREYNLALAERRADAVRNYLTSAGIDASRLRTISYGKERPAVLGTGEEIWRQNRRSVSVVDVR